MATNSREARRRRIVERGSDRLALITGRIQALPPSSPEPLSSPNIVSSPPLISQDQGLQTHLSDQSNVSTHGEVKSFGSVLPKHDSSTETDRINAYDGGSIVEPYLRNCETSIEALRTPLEVSGEIQPSLVSSTVQKSSISNSGTEQRVEPQTQQRRFFTPNQISSAIAASENIRIFCSLTVAILVVLSYLGFPLLRSNFIKSTAISRPLYLVLLTNLTVVLARLLSEKQRGSERAEKEASKFPSEDGYGWAEQAGKALESGLVLQKVIDAVFMDCSVYAVVVICGLSLAQQLSW